MSDEEYYEEQEETQSSESESHRSSDSESRSGSNSPHERAAEYHGSGSDSSDHEGGGGGGGGFLAAAAMGAMGGHGSSGHGGGRGGHGGNDHSSGGAGGMLGGLVKGFAKLAAKDKEKLGDRDGGQQGYASTQGYPQGQGYQGQDYQGQTYQNQPYQAQPYNQGPGYAGQGYQGSYDQREVSYQQYPQGQGQGGYSSSGPQMQYYGPSTQDANGNTVQHSFQWSRCSGKKKALLIGINYFGQEGELAGCINDAHNVRRFIIERFGYRPEDIVMLLDDSRDPRETPTRANIIKAMQWLVQDAQPDDSLVIHYSGHGASVEDVDGDEHDDSDEAICPLDYKEAGMIIDDERESRKEINTDRQLLPLLGLTDASHDILIKPLVAGVRLLAIFDSCHSGTVLDLPFVYNTKGAIKEPNLINENEILKAGLSYLQGDSASAFSMFKNIAKDAFGARKSHQKTLKTKTSPADCILLSGCKDAQTSADTTEAGKATGAMSWALITSLNQNHTQSYQELLNSVRDLLESQYSQTVQLSSSHPMDMSLQFVA